MDKEKSISTPMSTSCNLDKDEGGKLVKESRYRGMSGFIFYLTTSCPDIMFNVCLYACFQVNPKESYLTAVKRIMRYLTSITLMGLWYSQREIFCLSWVP